MFRVISPLLSASFLQLNEFLSEKLQLNQNICLSAAIVGWNCKGLCHAWDQL